MGEWIEIRHGCEMPEILADSRTDNWDWSTTVRVVYLDTRGKHEQGLASLSKDIRDNSTKFILNEGQAVAATHWKHLDWPAPPETTIDN